MKARDFPNDPSLSEFVPVEAAGWRILARRGYEAWADELVSGGISPTEVIGGGRVEHPVVGLPEGGEAVVRRYHRGGMMRHVNRDRYLLGHRAFEEVRVTGRAAAAGVRVPEVIAAGERRSGGFYRAWLATRMIRNTRGLEQRLAKGGGPAAEALRAAAEQIARMHDAGITHPDLNLRNLLVVDAAQPPQIFLIDFDKAALLPHPVDARQRARELLRLARSARKLGVPLDTSAWAALRRGYGSDWPSDLLPVG